MLGTSKAANSAEGEHMKSGNYSLNLSLDTNSSMNTADSDSACHTGRESSLGDLHDCPFLGQRLYIPLKEQYKQELGLLYLGKRRDTNEKVVIKLIDRGPSVTKGIVSELLLHRECSGHPLFVQLVDVFLAPRHLAIVMEHVEGGGDLLELITDHGPLPEDKAQWLFQQLVVGILFLHSKGSKNREIKLQNKLLTWHDATEQGNTIMVDARTESLNSPMELSPSPRPPGADHKTGRTSNTVSRKNKYHHKILAASGRPSVKIRDFMYSKSEQINSDPHSALGSLPYTAPEILNNTIKEGGAADVWALGVALFKIVTGMYPFEHAEDAKDTRATVQAVLGRITRAEYTIPSTLSPNLQDLLILMLNRDPQKRITLSQVLDHPWVQSTMPIEMVRLNSSIDTERFAPLTEATLRALAEEAQQSLRPLDSNDVDELADDIFNEEEADDLLDELSLLD